MLKNHRLTRLTLFIGLGLSVLTILAPAGCGSKVEMPKLPSLGGATPTASAAQKPTATGARIEAVNLNNPVVPVTTDQPIELAAAKNEWTNFAVEISGLPHTKAKKTFYLRATKLSGGANTIDAQNLSAFQILQMPIDVNRAGFVRHTGLGVTRTKLPRALLPLPMNNGTVDLSISRDPSHPGDPNASGLAGSESLMFWVDLHIPPETPAGSYVATCDLLEGDIPTPVSSVKVGLKVYDFVLPDERHLAMVGRLDWESVRRLYPHFESVEPRLVSRANKLCAPAIRTLDQLVMAAQTNRTEVIIPRLQPVVKWPPGQPPVVNWDEYDPLVKPWLSGSMFPDKVPLAFWPMPEIDKLQSYPIASQLEYWSAAASHFDQLNWIRQAAVFLEKPAGRGMEGGLADIELSKLASRILNTQARLRVMLPLEEGQIQLASGGDPTMVDDGSVDRLFVASPSLVSNSPIRVWPPEMSPMRWLRTDTPGLIPYVGAGGDERDVRLWAWLAFLRKQSTLILWGNALPSADTPAQPADPNELIWFYPGNWFGVDQPVPSIQLKWLRRAQQDYEYLWLAKQRGRLVDAMLLARLITKPVEIQPNQPKDPTYAMMSGTTDAQAWNRAIDLLAKNVLLNEPGRAPSQQMSRSLDQEMLGWAQKLERPTIIGRTVKATIDPTIIGAGPSINVKIGIDVYNASDARPDENTLEYNPTSRISPGWIVEPRPTKVAALATYHVERFNLDAQIDPSKIVNTDRRSLDLLFIEPNYNIRTTASMFIPIAASDRHPPGLILDGSLEDWTGDDAILDKVRDNDQKLVQMFNRPALQKQQVEEATTSTRLYTGWTDETFYVAFKVEGVSEQELRSTKNFASYQFRRAWGEDACQVLVQAVYKDNSLGPALHLVIKPNGSCWIERKGDAMSTEQWPTIEARVPYVATLEGNIWRGELAIPWKAISPDKGIPVLLRFNFTQHKTASGESASWAGPVDFGRDDAFTGLLFIRDIANPGMVGANGR